MLMPITVTSTELQRNYRKVVQMAKKNNDAVVVMTNSVAEGVYMDYDTYVKKFVASELYKRDNAKKDLLSLSGLMSAEEAEKLNKDIDEMNETIEPEDWK